MSTTQETRLKRLEGRKREAQFGFANNAFGAAAGAAATSAVYAQQKRTLRTAKKPPVDEWAAKHPSVPKPKPVKAGLTERGLKRLKVKPKYVLPAVAATAVGSQIVNGAMDAQSASYFAREVKDLRAKEKRMESRMAKNDASLADVVIHKASDGVGRNLNTVEKGLPSALKSMQLVGKRPYKPSMIPLVEANARTTRLTMGHGTARDRAAAAMERKHQAGKIAAQSKKSPGMRSAAIGIGRTDAAAYKEAVNEARPLSRTARTNYDIVFGSNTRNKIRYEPNRERAVRMGKSEDVSKKLRRFDSETDRNRRLGVYEGAAGAGGVAMGALGVTELRAQARKQGLKLSELGTKLKPYRTGGALVAGGTAATGVAVAAHRRAKSARNDPWN